MRQVIEVRRRGARRCLPPIAAASVLLLCAIATAKGQGPEVKVIEIGIGDNMRYTPSVIDAEPGQKLRVVLRPVGKIKALGHNFVLLKQGTEAKPFVDKAADATEQTGDIPPAVRDQVIAEIPLVRSGNTGEVTFEAPVQRGEYDFVCTFPSHFKLGMKGRLIVKWPVEVAARGVGLAVSLALDAALASEPGSWGVPRPSLAPYVLLLGPTGGATAAGGC